MALHRDAAARACEAFRERRSDKAYIAVLEGVVDAAAVPRREDEPAGWGEGEGGDGAAKGRKNRPNAVQHMPAHGFFQRKKVPSCVNGRASARFAWAMYTVVRAAPVGLVPVGS